VRTELLEANARLLQQGRHVLRDVDPRIFAGEGAAAGSIGAHLRHCLDFYDAFFRGARRGVVDYDARERDPRTESDLPFALARVERTAARLTALEGSALPDRFRVRIGGSGDGDAPQHHADSSPERELDALFSHTVHHWALIAGLLRAAGHDVPVEFGVAPSTLRARGQAAAGAG